MNISQIMLNQVYFPFISILERIIQFTKSLKCNLCTMYTLTAVVNATVIVKVVVDQVYKPEYDDYTSPVYKDFVKNFTQQVSKIAVIVNINGTMIDISSKDKTTGVILLALIIPCVSYGNLGILFSQLPLDFNQIV